MKLIQLFIILLLSGSSFIKCNTDSSNKEDNYTSKDIEANNSYGKDLITIDNKIVTIKEDTANLLADSIFEGTVFQEKRILQSKLPVFVIMDSKDSIYEFTDSKKRNQKLKKELLDSINNIQFITYYIEREVPTICEWDHCFAKANDSVFRYINLAYMEDIIYPVSIEPEFQYDSMKVFTSKVLIWGCWYKDSGDIWRFNENSTDLDSSLLYGQSEWFQIPQISFEKFDLTEQFSEYYTWKDTYPDIDYSVVMEFSKTNEELQYYHVTDKDWDIYLDQLRIKVEVFSASQKQTVYLYFPIANGSC
jgi:hypothetical protein